VKTTLEGLQCELARPLVKNEPVTVEAMVIDAQRERAWVLYQNSDW